MNAHSKHSAQASISLHSMRGKSWSFYQKHISNLIGMLMYICGVLNLFKTDCYLSLLFCLFHIVCACVFVASTRSYNADNELDNDLDNEAELPLEAPGKFFAQINH